MANPKGNKITNVPNLRFGKSAWNKSKISDEIETVTDFVAAGSFADLRNKVKYHNEPNYAQLIRTTDLKNGFDEGIYIDDEAFNFLWRVNLDKESIILPNIGANIGESYFINPRKLPYERNVLGPNAILLRSKKNNNYFIYSYFQTNYAKNNIAKMVGASGQPKFNKTDLRKFEFYIPSIEEQNKIADFLNLVDTRIDTQNKIIKNLKTFKRYLCDLYFRKINKTSKFEHLINFIIPFNEKTTEDNQYRVLSSTASGIMFQDEYFNKEASSSNTTGYKIVPFGYCTYRSMSDTGEFYFNKQCITEKGIVSPAYPVFKIKDDFCDYILVNLNRNSFVKKQILAGKSGGTRFALPLSKLLKIKIPFPDSFIEMSNFICEIESISNKILNEENVLNLLMKQKSYLLNNLFI